MKSLLLDNFDKMVRSHGDEYVTDMNWKLAIDTFGETYHFQFIHKDSLFENVYGNLQMFDTFKRNARSIILKRDMDEIRKLPEEKWDILQAALPIYYLFPNIIFIPTVEGAFFIKVYPLENSPHKCVSKISFYFHPEVIEIAEKMGVWNTTKSWVQNLVFQKIRIHYKHLLLFLVKLLETKISPLLKTHTKN